METYSKGTETYSKAAKRVETKDAHGNPNGWLLELVSDRDPFIKHIRGQMYLTVVQPGAIKGFHLHATANYYVACIKGRVRETFYLDMANKYVFEMGDNDFKVVHIPSGAPHSIENFGDDPAYVLIYRYPAWDPDINDQLDIAPEDIEQAQAWERIAAFMRKHESKA